MARFRSRLALVAIVALASVMLPLAPPAGGAPPDGVEVLAEGLVGPLSLAVGRDGKVYVAQSFAGKLSVLTAKGNARDLVTSTSRDSGPGAVAVRGKSKIVYLDAGRTGTEEEPDFIGFLRRLLPTGKIRTLGDISTFEETRNPDQGNSYGFQGISKRCRAKVDAAGVDIPGSASKGTVDSNPYAVAIVPKRGFVVADAGANAVFSVRKHRVRTLAVLPPVPLSVTRGIAEGFGLPRCTAGSTFNFDPVPTDVEYGPDGLIYVSSLAGGPEDGSIQLGGVFTIDPRTGDINRIGSGFTGATDLAVTPDGRVFVTELFANRVSELVDGQPEAFIELRQPGAIEYHDGALYVTTGVLKNGKVVKVTL